jgi:hypothetical protein
MKKMLPKKVEIRNYALGFLGVAKIYSGSPSSIQQHLRSP